MKWEKKKIKEFTSVITGGTPSTSVPTYWENGNIPWINSGELNQEFVTSCSKYITKEGLQSSSSRLMPPDTVLIALTGTTTGKTAYLTFEACANQSVTGILPSSVHNPKYLYYFLTSYRSKILNDAYGGAQKHISQQYVKEIEVPLPPLHIQQQIADTLDKANALRRKDQELLQKYDELAQAIFYDMFGDPVKNDKMWQVKLFSEVGSLDRGVSKHRPRNAPELLGGIYPLIQTGDVSNCKGYIKSYTQTYSEIGYKQSKLWPKGTLCITIAANIAKTGVLTFDACFPDSVVGFIPNQHVRLNYVRFWLMHLQKYLEDSAPESAQKNINLEILRSLKMPVPPTYLQDKFEEALKLLYMNTGHIDQTLKNTTQLFSSILQNNFK